MKLNVLVEKQKLDILANAISAKSGEPVTMTLDEMVEAVDEIETGGGMPALQSKTATPTESAQTIIADSGYDGLSQVTVGAIPPQYIIPSGTYTVDSAGTKDVTQYASASIPSGTAGTPSASKGTVSNHAISVTPSVTNTTGWITGSTKTGTAVSVSASELVSGTYTVSASGTHDVTNYATATVPSADPWLEITTAYSGSGNDRTWTATPKVLVDVADGDTAGFMADGYEKSSTEPLRLNAVPSNTTITPTESPQAIGGSSYIMEGAVTVNAISSTYVGSGITRRSSSDLTASGATVTVPSGYYSAQTSKSVSNGTTGTPTATKGTVSNHSVSVTPSVTNTTGYITGGTINGTAVSVSASELVSGTYNITTSGTHNVTNYANASVTFSTIYTGSSNPSSSTGANGDIYIKVVS